MRSLSAGRRADAVSLVAHGAYGRSVESGKQIPDARLEAEPLAERTVEELRLYERRSLGRSERH